MLPAVHILAIGNELLNGAVQDTNSAYLCRTLNDLGLAPSKVVLLRDNEDEIAAEIRRSAAEASLILCTGGLGPTSDDKTRFVLADVLGVPLVEDPGARGKLEAIFASRKREMSVTNLRQVVFPVGAEIIENSEGTADAFRCRLSSGTREVPIICLPGIPRELRSLTVEKLCPWIKMSFPGLSPLPRKYLRCFGRTESYLAKKIEELGLPDSIEVAYRPMFPEILLSFSLLKPDEVHSADETLERIVDSVAQAVGEDFAFTRDAELNMAKVSAALLLERGLKFAAAESCTGGGIADSLVAIPGISASFLGSFVTYTNSLKENILGVKSETLSRFGAVSAQTAMEMARGAREKSEADIAVSVTGVAGPDGGTEEKPVGTVWIGISTPEGEEAVEQFYNLERNLFRAFAETAALDLLRRKLLGLTLSWQRL